MALPNNTKIPRKVFFRIKVLLVIVLLSSWVWEFSKSQKLTSSQGKVIQVKKVFAGRNGDSREFSIEYSIKSQKHVLITRRGVVDALGKFCCLKVGDSVAIAVNKQSPKLTVLDSYNARYPLTLSFLMVTVVMFLSLWIFVRKKKNQI